MTLDLPAALHSHWPDWNRLRDLFVELEFRGNAQEAAALAGAAPAPVARAAGETAAAPPVATPSAPAVAKKYEIVDTVEGVTALVARARRSRFIAVGTETVPDAGAPPIITPLRANLVGISIAIAPGESFYLPLRAPSAQSRAGRSVCWAAASPSQPKRYFHRSHRGTLALGRRASGTESSADTLAGNGAASRTACRHENLQTAAHNTKYDLLVLRRAGVELDGLDFDSMLA